MLIKASVAAAAVSVAAMALPAVAAADASDDYPIPNRILKTTCTVDQYTAAVRDVEPIYYQRYMIDYNNRPPDIQQGARDRIYWFFSLDYAGRRHIPRTPRPTSTTSRWQLTGATGPSCSSTTRASPRTAPMSVPPTRPVTSRYGTGNPRAANVDDLGCRSRHKLLLCTKITTQESSTTMLHNSYRWNTRRSAARVAPTRRRLLPDADATPADAVVSRSLSRRSRRSHLTTSSLLLSPVRSSSPAGLK
jgi:hypothetical protein